MGPIASEEVQCGREFRKSGNFEIILKSIAVVEVSNPELPPVIHLDCPSNGTKIICWRCTSNDLNFLQLPTLGGGGSHSVSNENMPIFIIYTSAPRLSREERHFRRESLPPYDDREVVLQCSRPHLL